MAPSIKVAAVHGYLLEGSIDADEASLLANKLLADSIVEKTVVAPVGAPLLNEAPVDGAILVHVINKPGVMDPVAMSAQQGISDLGIGVEQVRTFRSTGLPGWTRQVCIAWLKKYWPTMRLNWPFMGLYNLRHLRWGPQVNLN